MVAKKIIKALILIMFVLLINGCGVAMKVSSPNSETQSPVTKPSDALTDTSDNTSKSPSAQVPQASQSSAPQIPILYYHSVMLEVGNELRTPPDQFEAQMAYLKEQGYQSITLNQLYQAFYKGGSLPPKPVVITFDDGYVDNYTNAFPILEKYEYTATVFMVSSYIDGKGFLSWSQLKELAASGWEIEGHTITHPYLSKVDEATLRQELKSSKELLEKGLGKPVDFFAHPYGDYNSVVTQAIKDTGYLMAFTTKRGWANPKEDALEVKRVYCYANMGQNEFARRLQNSDY